MSIDTITAVPNFKAFARADAQEVAKLTADSPSQAFGPDGLTFGDVLDAINPLNHIPIVSDIYSSLVGHKASPGARLAGGALFGGPIGIAASIASLMFEEGTGGKSPAVAVYAALTDETPATTQLAQNEATPSAKPDEEALASNDAAPVEPVTLASLSPAAGANAPRVAPDTAARTAAAPAAVDASGAVLDLYGASAGSAHHSYQKAQLLPYLRDVSVSKVL